MQGVYALRNTHGWSVVIVDAGEIVTDLPTEEQAVQLALALSKRLGETTPVKAITSTGSKLSPSPAEDPKDVARKLRNKPRAEQVSKKK